MAAFFFTVCFVLLQVIRVFSEQNHVTVITDPPYGPFLIRNRINFTCHVYPMPSEPVTYRWNAVKDAYGPTTLSGQRTIHYTPYERDLHFSWFFCKVFSNESLIGIGRRRVELHGFVFSVKPSALFRTFVLGSTIQLQVNVSTDFASHIETLNWYHNETEIPSSSRVSVLNSGRRIIIRDATHADAGNYKVEIASLDFNDSVCDSVWLPLLRNHAAHAPVTFTLNLMSTSTFSSTDLIHHSIMENLPLQYYPLVNGDISTLLTINYNTNFSSSWTYNIVSDILNYVSPALSVNGSMLTSNASKFNLSQRAMEPGSFTQVINFQYGILDEGFYIQYLHFHSYYLYRRALRDQGHRCWDHYDYADYYLHLRLIAFVTFPFILTTYKPPSQINISSISFAESGLTQLVCTAIGGVPDSHNITLFHSNQPITVSKGNKIQLYIANSIFGEFTCIVDSLYNTEQVSLLLQEEASFQLLLAENKKMACIQWKKVNSAFYEDIKTLFNKICYCSVDLEHVTADCSRTGPMLLSGTVIYSNSNGNITATTLIDMLQAWLLTSTDPVVMLQNQPFKLLTQCPIRLTPTTIDACSNLKVAPVTSESAVIGGSFIGGVLTGIFGSLATLCIGLCVLKLKADMSMRNAGSTSETSQTVKDEEVVMGTNQAYETVEMRYQPASRNQQPAVSFWENISPEPVYENQQHL